MKVLYPLPQAESHSYTDRLDQTFLPAIVSDCRAILRKFPPKEPKG